MNGRFIRTAVPCWHTKDRRHEVVDESVFCVRCGKMVVETPDAQPLLSMPIAINTHAEKLYVVSLLAERFGLRCLYCGLKLLDPNDPADRATLGIGTAASLHPQYPTIDHVIPRALGGRTELGNLVLSCPPCNGRKGDQLTVVVELLFSLRSRVIALEGGNVDRS